MKHRGTIINEFISNFPVVVEQLNDKYDICMCNVVEFFNRIGAQATMDDHGH